MSDPIASLRAQYVNATPETADLVIAIFTNFGALLDAAGLLQAVREGRHVGMAEIDAVLSRLHVEDTP